MIAFDRSIRIFLVLCIFGGLLLAEQQTSAVRFLIFDTFGHPIKEAQITLTDPRGQARSLTIQHKGSVVLPYELYRIEAIAKGFSAYRGTLLVNDAHSVVSLALQVGWLTTPTTPCRLVGRIESNVDPSRIIWIRLFSLYSDTQFKALLSEKNRFEIVGVPRGKYIFLVYSEGELIYNQLLEFKCLNDFVSIP